MSVAQFDALLAILTISVNSVCKDIYGALCCETKWMNLTIAILDFGVRLYGSSELSKPDTYFSTYKNFGLSVQWPSLFIVYSQFSVVCCWEISYFFVKYLQYLKEHKMQIYLANSMYVYIYIIYTVWSLQYIFAFYVLSNAANISHFSTAHHCYFPVLWL